MLKLQKIVFPPQLDDTVELYFRAPEALKFNASLQPVFQQQFFSFDTYFNMFSLESWKRYTTLDNVSLSLTVKGECKVCLYGVNHVNIPTLLSEHAIAQAKMTEVILPFPATDSQMLYWTLEPGDGFAFGEAWYCTEAASEQLALVLVDIVICTFKREQYLRRNLAMLADFYRNYPDFGRSLRVLVVDNGQTLSASDMPEGPFSLIPNENLGGSGGFARGMLEALERKDAPRASHVLIMDDDVLMLPESLILTISFLRLLKQEYAGAFLGFAMLDLLDKTRMHENQAFWRPERKQLTNLKELLSLKGRSECLYADFPLPAPTRESRAYQGWWGCVIPMQAIAMFGLSYPFFFQADDIEYGVRTSPSSIIHVNGICIWHMPFSIRSAPFKFYFNVRNDAITFTLLDPKHRGALLQYVIWKFAQRVLTFNYNCAESLCEGMEDYLKGPNFLKDPATCGLVMRKFAGVDKVQPISELPKKTLLMRKFFVPGLSRLQKIICILTLNGHLLPPALRKPQSVCSADSVSNYYLRSSVLFVCPISDVFEQRTASFRKLWSLGWRFARLWVRVALNFGRLSKEYGEAHAEMTSPAFWKVYLGLNKAKDEAE